MARDVGNSAVVTALNSGQLKTALMFEMSLVDDNGNREYIYATDNNNAISYNGVLYYALGHLVGISGIEEFNDSRIAQVTVTLSGLDNNMVPTILSYNYMDRPLKIYRAFLSDTTTAGGEDDGEDSSELLDQPLCIFEGTTDSPHIEESQSQSTLTVSINASSRFSEFSLRSGRHTNHQEQQTYASGDLMFEQIGKMSKDLVWGMDD